jgi:hypothetical protein
MQKGDNLVGGFIRCVAAQHHQAEYFSSIQALGDQAILGRSSKPTLIVDHLEQTLDALRPLLDGFPDHEDTK